MVSFLRWWGPLLAYMCLIFYLSSSSRPVLLQYAPDYAWHFFGYFMMGVLSVRAFAQGLALPAGGRHTLYALVLAMAYALSDEWHQRFVPRRMASLEDLVADFLGIMGALAVLSIYWWFARWPDSPAERTRW
ncbi:MAG TPA: VanZ family protein [Vicinamibacteria bacterium]|jgi:VanZ family protein